LPELLCFLSEYVISETNGHKFRFVKENMRQTAGTERLKWILQFRITIDRAPRNFCRRQEMLISLWALALILSANVRHRHLILTIVIYLSVSYYRFFWHQMLRHLMRLAAFEERYLAVDSSRQRTLVLDRSKEYRCGDDDVSSVVMARDLEERIV